MKNSGFHRSSLQFTLDNECCLISTDAEKLWSMFLDCKRLRMICCTKWVPLIWKSFEGLLNLSFIKHDNGLFWPNKSVKFPWKRIIHYGLLIGACQWFMLRQNIEILRWMFVDCKRLQMIGRTKWVTLIWERFMGVLHLSIIKHNNGLFWSNKSVKFTLKRQRH